MVLEACFGDNISGQDTISIPDKQTRNVMDTVAVQPILVYAKNQGCFNLAQNVFFNNYKAYW